MYIKWKMWLYYIIIVLKFAFDILYCCYVFLRNWTSNQSYFSRGSIYVIGYSRMAGCTMFRPGNLKWPFCPSVCVSYSC